MDNLIYVVKKSKRTFLFIPMHTVGSEGSRCPQRSVDFIYTSIVVRRDEVIVAMGDIK